MAFAPPIRNSLVKAMWSASGPAMEIVLPGVIVPDSHVEFVFHLGNPGRQRRVDELQWTTQPRSFVLSMSYGALRLGGDGNASMVAFRVGPLVASMILGQSLHDSWNEPIPLRDFIHSEADALTERLEAGTSGERFGILHRWIERRLAGWNSGHHRLHGLFERVMWSAPTARLPMISSALGWSDRGLRRALAQSTGLSPKEIQLAGRHLDACALLRDQPELDITEIAGRVGFFDHAAFTHSFRQRVGMTPSHFRREPHAYFERRP